MHKLLPHKNVFVKIHLYDTEKTIVSYLSIRGPVLKITSA